MSVTVYDALDNGATHTRTSVSYRLSPHASAILVSVWGEFERTLRGAAFTQSDIGADAHRAVVHEGVSSGGAIYGLTTTIIAGISDGLIQSQYFPDASASMQSFWTGLLTSCILVGGGVGCFVGLAFVARYGFRHAFAWTGGICLIFSVLLGAMDGFVWTTLWRTLQGISVGMAAALVPLYVTEVVELESQGRIGTVIQIAICAAIMLAEFSNWVFNMSGDLAIATWKNQVQLGESAVIGFAMLVSAPFFAESPAFEAKRQIAAAKSPVTRSSESSVRSEYPTLIEVAAIHPDGTETSLGLRDLFRKEWRSSLWIALVLAATDQLTGINAIVFYAPSIFTSAGLDNVLLWTIFIVGLWNLISVLVVVGIVDKFGRKPLMLTGVAGMGVACGIMCVAYAWLPSAKDELAIVAMLLFFAAFQLGPGALFFLLAAESFPVQIRDAALSFTQLAWWIFNVLVVFVFPMLQTHLSIAWTFSIFVGTCVGSFILLAIITKETKHGHDDTVQETTTNVQDEHARTKNDEYVIHSESFQVKQNDGYVDAI